MRETFADPELQRQFALEGFVTCDLLDEQAVAEVRRVVDELYPEPPGGMHTTIQSPDSAYRRCVIERIPPLVTGELSALLVDHDLLTASLAIKWPGVDTGFCTHQDWTMVDEQRFRSVNAWIPLVDVDERNGALGVLPGSHLVLDHLRCSPMNPGGFVCEANDVSHQELDLVPLRAGQALLFDNGLLHGSGPNLTDGPRVVIIVAMKPREADILHFFLPDAGSWVADRYEVGTDFFADYVIGQPPEIEPVGATEFFGTPRTRKELLMACGREPSSEPDREVVPTPPVDFQITRSGTKGRTSHDGRFPTFVDEDLDRELAIEGFVVVDLLDDATLAELRDLAEGVYVDERHGFHASNLSGSHDYRREVARRVAPIVERAAGHLFVDHEAYTASLLMKWPDEDSAFHSHQDWTMVDETRYRTVNVWCPLGDTTVDNGALRLAPGSHMVLDSIRCSPMPPVGYQNPGWAVGWQEMHPVEVRAGQVVIFDHAVLHSSGPNTTEQPRMAVAAAFKPREASLYHWYLPDASSTELERFLIDADFFADIDIGERPDYEVVGTEDFVWRDLTREELLETCGLAAVEPPASPDAEDDTGAAGTTEIEGSADALDESAEPPREDLQPAVATGAAPRSIALRTRAIRLARRAAARGRAGLGR